MEKKEFKAESKRLLEMMINSIYTHKEIFLRELISNASDAIDKLYFKSLTDSSVGLNKDDFAIQIRTDKDARTITISDNGIGMTKDELENNLGVIAKSGSLAFKSQNDLGEDVDIIGQFGVGFYSAFMVAKLVTVSSKSFGSDEAYQWQSEGVDGYTIEPCDKQSVGTEIVLKLKDNSEEENYDEYLESYRLEDLIKKYSDYIRFPIKLDKENRNKNEPSGEWETFKETVTVNSMVPIWKKNKSELTDEDYNKFYKEKFYDYEPPIAHIHSKNEGTYTYNALLYIPSKAPYDYYTKEYEKGLQLYSNGVLIMDKCSDLLPDHFSFVKGLVDSEDLSLNISREMLQHDRQLKVISKNIEKSIKNELTKMLNNDREKYETFYKAFGMQLKAGVQSSFMNPEVKDNLKELLLFHSLKQDKLITLDEYVTGMSEDQKYIFYATGETISKIKHLPQSEAILDKGYDILCCTDRIDEFALKMLHSYKEKDFKSIADNDLDLETAEEKKKLETKTEENKALFDYMKDALHGKVSEVRLSTRLKKHPVCLTSKGEISIEMEKILNSMPNQEKVLAEKILEINPEHPVLIALSEAYNSNDKAKVEQYTELLYNQALLIEGLPIEDPVEFSNLICNLMK